MVLGHEAAGVVVEVGEQVNNLKPGDRVCMEPGIPDPNSRAARLGIYNRSGRTFFGSLELSLPVSRTIWQIDGI
jgi:threonine dehydrogenase-like Zn-dependent dehydrogenase